MAVLRLGHDVVVSSSIFARASRAIVVWCLALLLLIAVSGCGAANGPEVATRYSIPPTAAAQLLAGLRTPPGFRRDEACAFKQHGEVCFKRAKAVLLDDEVMLAIVRELGAEPLPGAQGSARALHCSPRLHLSVRGPQLAPCALLAVRRGERVVVFVTSVAEVRAGKSVTSRGRRATHKGGPKVIFGTEIDVGAVGKRSS